MKMLLVANEVRNEYEYTV